MSPPSLFLASTDGLPLPAQIYDDYGNKPLKFADGRAQENSTGFSTRLNVLTGYRATVPEPHFAAPVDKVRSMRVIRR